MKSEALKQLLAIARKRMAAEEDESLGSKLEEEAEASPMAEAGPSEDGEEPVTMEQLLNFLKQRTVSEPTSKMAAMPSKSAPKAKGSHLFKKKESP